MNPDQTSGVRAIGLEPRLGFFLDRKSPTRTAKKYCTKILLSTIFKDTIFKA
jgi:hypothetical protein